MTNSHLFPPKLIFLGQGKTVWQAEIDAACEVIDFLRFNVQFAQEIYSMQPPKNSKGVWNRVAYRALVTPVGITL